MGRGKRERRRLKRAEKRKRQARQEAQAAQALARHDRAFQAAWTADRLMHAGRTTEAVTAAARAATLAPRDRRLAALYVAAADGSRDPELRLRAYEHLARVAEPDATLLITLADLYASTGRTARAWELTARARAILPRRLRDRRRWLELLESVESRCAPERAPAMPTTDGQTLLPFDGNVGQTVGPADATEGPGPQARAEGATEPEPAPPATFDIEVSIGTSIGDLSALASGVRGTLDDIRLNLLAATIREASSYDHLLAVERAQGLLRLSHQEETARRVLSVLLGRALLADEVGLGKTIEAGLVLLEYMLRGHVGSALVLTPPSLVAQWREELGSKFGIDTRTTDDPAFRAEPARFWARPGVVIASLATARAPRHRDAVAERSWDLIIVDEAHMLKNARTQAYALVSRLTSRFFLLLTATPVENNVEELYNLVSLIRPGQLGGRAEFVRRFGGARRRISEAARRELRGLLSEVMIRNTRALSGVRLPPRFARTVLVDPRPAERELYDHLVAVLRALGPGGRTRLLLSVLLQEAGSSPQAVAATLEKIRDDSVIPAAAKEALVPAVSFAARLPETGKGHALARVLAESDGATVVFTRFRATLGFLHSFLGGQGVSCERVDGDTPVPLRHDAIERCRRRGSVLLSTDVGSEGLNLQFCRRVVNFDLPWNPMRIEQRIGRVHRIGQEHPVDVVNLCLAGSIEERILLILDERINLFELVVGEVEMILGYLEEEGEFSEVMLNAFATADPREREQRFARIGDALAVACARYQNVKAFDEAFFRNELGV